MAVVNTTREDEIRQLEALEDTIKGLYPAATQWGFQKETGEILRIVSAALDERYVKRARDAR